MAYAWEAHSLAARATAPPLPRPRAMAVLLSALRLPVFPVAPVPAAGLLHLFALPVILPVLLPVAPIAAALLVPLFLVILPVLFLILPVAAALSVSLFLAILPVVFPVDPVAAALPAAVPLLLALPARFPLLAIILLGAAPTLQRVSLWLDVDARWWPISMRNLSHSSHSKMEQTTVLTLAAVCDTSGHSTTNIGARSGDFNPQAPNCANVI